MDADSTRFFLGEAMAATGLTIEQLAQRLGYKTLTRVYAGEFALPEAKLLHIKDLMELYRTKRVLVSGTKDGMLTDCVSAEAAIENASVHRELSQRESDLRVLLGALPQSVLRKVSDDLLRNPSTEKMSVVQSIIGEMDRRIAQHSDAKSKH